MKSHIQLPSSKKFSRVIACGPPERAKVIAGFLTKAELIAQNREYHSYAGTFAGKDILVISHGVGAPGASICFQELINAGAESLIRIGTAGGLYDSCSVGDIVIPTAAVRNDGVSAAMIPLAYPSVPDLYLTQSLLSHLKTKSVRHQYGIILTSDLFYPGPLATDLSLYAKAGVLAVEMECSALFVIGQLRRIKTASALVTDGNPLKWEEGHYDPDPAKLLRSVESCVEAALQALVSEL